MTDPGGIVCPSCGAPGAEFLGKVPVTDTFAGMKLPACLPPSSLYLCPACALRFKWPRLRRERTDELYAASGTEAPVAYQSSGRRDWDIIRRFLSRESGGAILDIGCHDGAFLRTMTGWTPSGVEMSPSAARAAGAAGIQIVGTDFYSLPRMGGRYKAITVIDVIEHSDSPRAFLAAAADLLLPGGVLIVSTGDSCSPTARLMGSAYWYYALADHISFINREWCSRAAVSAGLSFDGAEQFSHSDGEGVVPAVGEAARNLFYRLFPGVSARLRRLGAGNIDAASSPEMAYYPPSWRTARDHFVSFFRKEA